MDSEGAALTLSAMAARISLRTQAGVLHAAASVHAPDITGLNCKRKEQTYQTSLIRPVGQSGELTGQKEGQAQKRDFISRDLLVK